MILVTAVCKSHVCLAGGYVLADRTLSRASFNAVECSGFGKCLRVCYTVLILYWPQALDDWKTVTEHNLHVAKLEANAAHSQQQHSIELGQVKESLTAAQADMALARSECQEHQEAVETFAQALGQKHKDSTVELSLLRNECFDKGQRCVLSSLLDCAC